MASITFSTGTTITSTWLNDVDALVWDVFGGATTVGTARSALGLGTMATQAASSVAITGGSITGITDIAVADGGTGASTAADARTNLGAAASGAVTSSGLTMTTSKLLGRTTASTGAIEEISVTGTNVTFTSTALTIGMPRSYLAGLTLSNNGSDATNDIDIAVGACRDATNAADIVLASALTKQLDAAWAVGTNAGGLDTGAIANTVYYVWLIKRSDTGVVDALFSTSATSPTMPTNYDYKRRIGIIVRAAGAILLFTQIGDNFILKTPPQDTNTTVGTSRLLIGVTAPIGTIGKFRIYAYNSASTVAFTFAPTYETDAAPGTAGVSQRSEVSNQGTAGEYNIYVDSSRQIAARASVASSTITVWTIGWMDRRGRDD